MLSYRHAFHAGNHADILKHCCLVSVLDSMVKKEKPFTAIDSHGGAGLYQLDDERALKTGETRDGILTLLEKLDSSLENIPEALQSYLNLIIPYIKNNKYPGSPEIISKKLRNQDKGFVMELHNTEIDVLKSNIKDSKITILHQNCFEGLKALCPPEIKRGFLIMDPSYEVDSDYTNVVDSLALCHKKWNVGVLCLWYPLLKHRRTECEIMKDSIRSIGERTSTDVMVSELLIDSPERETGLYGSGMIVINPPWQLEEKMQAVIEFLQPILKEN